MHIVVFEGAGVELGGNYKGIRIQVGYKSREDFLRSQEANKNPDKVIAEGVTEEEAQALVNATPLILYFHAAVDEAFESGKLNSGLLYLKISNAVFLARLRNELE